MIRISAVLVGVLGLVLVTTATAAAQQASRYPTQTQLVGAILTEREIGGGFSVETSGPLAEGFNSYGMILTREWPVFELIALALADLRTGTPDQNALDYIEELTGSSRAEQLNAPRIGQNAARYVFEFRRDGTTYFGDVIAWQHDQVIAIAAIVSEDPDACACEVATAQQTKLAAAFPVSSGSTTRR